jgi:hypothetical protein
MEQVIVGSYHKTGSQLIDNIFKNYNKLESSFDYKFYDHFNEVSDEDIATHKCVVIIRHPCEIIMSGMRYHQKSNEEWLHRKLEKYGNSSYYECLKNSENVNEKILFEMRNCARETILLLYNDVKNRNHYKNVLFIKLEDFYTLEGLYNIISTIQEHFDFYIGFKQLFKAFSIALNFDYSRTNKYNCYTYKDAFTEHHYNELKNLFPEDLFRVLGYKL